VGPQVQFLPHLPHAKLAWWTFTVAKMSSTAPCVCVCARVCGGIGKSMFYAYFYDRYWQEHAESWLLMGSFSMQSTLLSVGINKPGQDLHRMTDVL
jgi:hypothetical protein